MNTRRPYLPGTIAAARVLESTFASDYHALQTSVERRGSRWSAKAYYTFGKAMEDIDYQGGGLPAVQNSNRIDLERGRTTNDRTHNFVMSGIWNVNYLDETKGAMARALLNGWTVSAIITMQSGQPLTINAGQDRNFDGLTTDRADLVGNPTLDSGRPREEAIEEWFSRAAFALPAIGTDGSAGRNIVEGPGVKNVDFGLFRDVPLGGRTMLQLRLEATEHVQLRQPEQPRRGLQQRRHVRPHPRRTRHASRAGRWTPLVLRCVMMGARSHARPERGRKRKNDDDRRPMLDGRRSPSRNRRTSYGCLSSVTDFGFALLGASSSVFSTRAS